MQALQIGRQTLNFFFAEVFSHGFHHCIGLSVFAPDGAAFEGCELGYSIGGMLTANSRIAWSRNTATAWAMAGDARGGAISFAAAINALANLVIFFALSLRTRSIQGKERRGAA